MKNKTIPCLILLVVFVASWQAAYSMSMSTLQNLSGVGVNVRILNRDARKLGLKEEDLRDLLKVQLQLAHIKVYNEDELFELPGAPTLELFVLVDEMEDGRGYIYTTRLSLQERVRLERPTETLDTVFAPTWEKSVLGITSLKKYINRSVRALAGRFVKEYKQENPGP